MNESDFLFVVLRSGAQYLFSLTLFRAYRRGKLYSWACWYLFNPRENAEQRVYHRLMTSELTFESRWSVHRIDSRTLDPANSMAAIYTNLDHQTESTRMSGTFYWHGLFVAPIFRFLSCVRAHTRFSIFHPTWSNSPVCTIEWHSHSSGICHSISNFALAIHAIPPCFSTKSNIILSSPYHSLHTQSFLVFQASVGLHLVTLLQASSIPQTSVHRVDLRFVKRIQRARVICFPVNSSWEDRRCRRGFTEDCRSRAHFFWPGYRICRRYYTRSERKEMSSKSNDIITEHFFKYNKYYRHVCNVIYLFYALCKIFNLVFRKCIYFF